MTRKSIALITSLSLCTVSIAFAGARPGNFALVNISKKPMNKEGQRLFELIQKDLKEIYNDGKLGFAWETDGTKIKTVVPTVVAGCFNHMIILKDKKKLEAAMEKIKASDGLIVFEYDLAGKKVRLKHFGWQQNENILIRLPLNSGGAMNLSIFKDRRRAALVALGKSFEFSP